MEKYIVTKEECRKSIKGVCEGCGSKLEAIETVDNGGNPTFWVACRKCSKYRQGIEKKYVKIARQLVETNTLIPYRTINRLEYEGNPESLEFYFETQTAGLSFTIKLIEKMLKECK